MGLLRDRYSLIALAVISIIAVICIADAGETEQDGSVTGVVENVRTTSGGNTFDLTDPKGDTIKCFSSETVNEGDVRTVIGKYSQDGSIFFISRMFLL